jgi:hypothetical protein
MFLLSSDAFSFSEGILQSALASSMNLLHFWHARSR